MTTFDESWLLVLLIEAGEPCRQPLDRSLELRVQVDEGA
jgi:hypothetical protein